MPYDQNLAKRIHIILEVQAGIIEKKMFGGVGFLLHGNMVCGVQADRLIVRVGAKNNAAALARPFTQPFMVTGGKPMEGWITVGPEGCSTEDDLRRWIELGYEFVTTLPAKE